MCVICSANHISYIRDCRVYAKERLIREIMSQMESTYRKVSTFTFPSHTLEINYSISNHKNSLDLSRIT